LLPRRWISHDQYSNPKTSLNAYAVALDLGLYTVGFSVLLVGLVALLRKVSSAWAIKADVEDQLSSLGSRLFSSMEWNLPKVEFTFESAIPFPESDSSPVPLAVENGLPSVGAHRRRGMAPEGIRASGGFLENDKTKETVSSKFVERAVPLHDKKDHEAQFANYRRLKKRWSVGGKKKRSHAQSVQIWMTMIPHRWRIIQSFGSLGCEKRKVRENRTRRSSS
jgi:hypothetical protein